MQMCNRVVVFFNRGWGNSLLADERVKQQEKEMKMPNEIPNTLLTTIVKSILSKCYTKLLCYVHVGQWEHRRFIPRELEQTVYT